ncbi:MAG: heme-binding protein, partial [Ornithinimicrobium sp.]
GTFDSAGNSAFGALFGYITGENESRDSIEMTAPVQQQAAPDTAPKSESMAMTAPVTQTRAGDGRYVVAFVLPATMTVENAPTPANPAVSIRVVPEQFAAAVTYSGRGSASAYDKHVGELLTGLAAAGLTPEGAPSSARFDAPSKPWLLRRNEVVQPVEAPDAR